MPENQRNAKSTTANHKRLEDVNLIYCSVSIAVTWFLFQLMHILLGVSFDVLGPVLKSIVVVGIGGAVGTEIARRISAGGTQSNPKLSNTPQSPPEQSALAGENITALPIRAPTFREADEWHVIHAGNELGPISRLELIAKAADGKVGPNDLVKKAGGLWTKAHEFDFLQQQLASRQIALNNLDRVQGDWLSKQALIGACVLLFLVSFAVPWALRGNASDGVAKNEKHRDNVQTPPAKEPVKDARFFSNRGAAFLHNGDYISAIEDLSEAIRLDPNDAVAFLDRGTAWAAKRNHNNAIKDFDESIRLNPDRGLAYYNRGVTRSQTMSYDIAINDFNEAIRLDPTFAPAYVNRGYAWSCKKNYNIAIRDYDDAIRLDPNCSFAYNHRGHSWFCKKNYDNALRDYDEAIRLDRNSDLAYERRGHVWWSLKDYDNAIRDYDEAIQINSNNASAFLFRGMTWLDKRDYDKAIADLDEAIRLNPNNALAYSCRASSWQYKNSYGKAQRDFDEANRLDPAGFPAHNVAVYTSSHNITPVAPRIGQYYTLCVTVTNKADVERPATVFLTEWPNGDVPIGPTSIALRVPAYSSRTCCFRLYCGVNGGLVDWRVE